MSRRSEDLDELVRRVRAGDARAVARLISFVERDSCRHRDIAIALAPFAGAAHVVGLTGVPGVGKSTLTSALVGVLRSRDRRVGVLAVDPTSPLSGGALLGDRVRMEEHATDPGVFVRSMASRGHRGGLAAAVPQALRVLETAGCEVVVVETVGVGQAELEVVGLADTTVLIVAPGLGDGVQAAKAGIVEVADVLVVNKSDRDGAAQLARDLCAVQSLGGAGSHVWRAPIMRTTATSGAGVGTLADAISEHRTWLGAEGVLEQRRRTRAAAEIEAIALARTRSMLAAGDARAVLETGAARVVAGDSDPYSAADELFEAAFGR